LVSTPCCYLQVVYATARAVVAVLLFLSFAAGYYFARRKAIPSLVKRGTAVMALALLGVVISYVQYNTGVALQPQARYLFVALLPISLALLGGLYVFCRRSRSSAFLLGIPPLLLILLNFVALDVLSV
jgi:hypothetical protein